jgi:hypothetical protein
LSDAKLIGADLSRADLSRADLSRANLSWADLSVANLSWADLSRANLSWADLSGADLRRAKLSGAIIDDEGTTIDKAPIRIQGSYHPITVYLRSHVRIGCICNPIEWWLENNVRAGEENGYSTDQISEYRQYIEFIELITRRD